MASVQETVIARIRACPDLYTNRSDVLYSLLTHNGTGWEWVDGEMVETDPDPRLAPVYSAEAELAELRARYTDLGDFRVEGLTAERAEQIIAEDQQWMADLILRHKARYDAAEQIGREAMERADQTGLSQAMLDEIQIIKRIITENAFDPMEGVPARNVPADVKPDWAEAVAEVRALLAEQDVNL